MFHVLDLFCGAGGLSLGFMQTGRYVIDVAAEIGREIASLVSTTNWSSNMFVPLGKYILRHLSWKT